MSEVETGVTVGGTGAGALFFGLAGEYAAINSAIDELIPGRPRGTIDIMMNGAYWAGAAIGAAVSVPVTSDLPVVGRPARGARRLRPGRRDSGCYLTGPGPREDDQ